MTAAFGYGGAEIGLALTRTQPFPHNDARSTRFTSRRFSSSVEPRRQGRCALRACGQDGVSSRLAQGVDLAPEINSRSFDPTLYVITQEPAREGRTLVQVVEAALAGGARVVQYRNKSRSSAGREEEAAALLALTKAAGALLIINDDPELAAKVGADGVHVGQGDADIAVARKAVGPGRLVGVSTGNAVEAERAVADGADYVGVGPVYATKTKEDARAPIGLGRLMKIVEAVGGRVPVVAIGGINEGNCGGCAAVGADGVAVVSAVMSAADPRAVAEMLRVRFEDGRPPKGVTVETD